MLVNVGYLWVQAWCCFRCDGLGSLSLRQALHRCRFLKKSRDEQTGLRSGYVCLYFSELRLRTTGTKQQQPKYTSIPTFLHQPRTAGLVRKPELNQWPIMVRLETLQPNSKTTHTSAVLVDVFYNGKCADYLIMYIFCLSVCECILFHVMRSPCRTATIPAYLLRCAISKGDSPSYHHIN